MAVNQARIVNCDLTPSAPILAANQLIADTALFTIMRAINFGATLDSLTLIDEAAQGAALSVVFLDVNQSLGAAGGLPNVSAANSVAIHGLVTFATTDYANFQNAKIATKGNLGLALKPLAGTQQIGIALLNGAGTPTYGATTLRLRLGIRD